MSTEPPDPQDHAAAPNDPVKPLAGEAPPADPRSPAPEEPHPHSKVTVTFQEYNELKTLAAERDDYLKRLRRAVADHMGLQNRLGKLREAAERDALRKVAGRVLPLVDGLGRAIDAASQTPGAEQILQGLTATRDEFYAILKGLGIRPIEAVGKPFDPHYHEAVFQQPAAGVAPHTVLQEVRQGFLLQDELLRPAQVVVSAEPGEGRIA